MAFIRPYDDNYYDIQGIKENYYDIQGIKELDTNVLSNSNGTQTIYHSSYNYMYCAQKNTLCLRVTEKYCLGKYWTEFHL